MDLEKEVRARFEANPALRILFLFDEDGAFSDAVEHWKEDGIHCIKADKKYFSLKYRLETELKDKKVLLYLPYREPTLKEQEDFPLLDLLVANKQLYLDPVRSFMEERGLSQIDKPVIDRYYQKELRHKNRQELLEGILTSSNFSASKLKKGLLCFHLGTGKIVEPNLCIAKLMEMALDKGVFEKLIDKLRDLDLEENLLIWLEELMGKGEAQLSHELIVHLANKLKYNLMIRFVEKVKPEDPYAKLREGNTILLGRMNALLVDWNAETSMQGAVEKVMTELASQVKEEAILQCYGSETKYGLYTAKLKELILGECIDEFEVQPEKTLDVLKQWHGSSGKKTSETALVNFLWHGASFYMHLKASSGFIYDTPEQYIRKYRDELYQLDFHYRKAADAFNSMRGELFSESLSMNTPFNKLLENYEEQFVNPLNYQWQQCLKERNFDFKKIRERKQYDFYKDNIAPLDQRVAVIISDAFRYEIAKEFAEELSKDPKNTVQISAMLGSIPSVTALGMSNLLPNDKIKIENGKILIGDTETNGLPNRAKILQSRNVNSDTIQFQDIIRFDQKAGRDYFKDKEVVYIYHNKIDAKGDKAITELSVFNAVGETLDDLHAMVRKLNGWNVYKVIITADHGFIFSLRDIPETMKEKMPVVTGEVLTHNRAVLAEKIDDTNGYSFDFSNVSNADSDLKVLIPRSVNRYSKSGSGVRYVHGGGSLQELIVPVIEYSRKREDISQKVNLKLVRFDDKISSGYFKARVIQVEPVSELNKEVETIIGLYDDKDELVSNMDKRTFNAASNLPAERTQEILLTLNSKGSVLSSCQFKVFDAEDTQRLNPIIKETILIKTLIERDEFS